jgi:hypothetical protein
LYLGSIFVTGLKQENAKTVIFEQENNIVRSYPSLGKRMDVNA